MLPASLVKLTNLTYLDIKFHEIGGPLPASFDSFAKIDSLQLAGMHLTGEIPALNLPVVTTITLSFNQLTGPIPSLDQVPKLGFLQLNGNNLEGTIPSLQNVPELNRLFLSDNQLTGPLPTLDHLRMTDLKINNNSLTGHLPVLPPEMARLDVSDNNFSGSLPSSFAKFPDLVLFFAHNNNFDGELSSTIFDLQNSRRSSFQETKNSPAHFHQS